MTGMVERVARTMCEGDGFKWMAESHFETANGENPDEQRDYWLDKARAAIEAMREPTEAMVDAGEDPEKVGFAADSSPAELVWRAMIDAALREDT